MAFGALIQQMLSAQNEQRQAAEAVFAEVKSNADLTVTNLLGLLKQSPNTESRAFCAVMLRKVVLLSKCSFSCLMLTGRCVQLWGVLHLQVLTKDDPSLWPQCTKEVQVSISAGARCSRRCDRQNALLTLLQACVLRWTCRRWLSRQNSSTASERRRSRRYRKRRGQTHITPSSMTFDVSNAYCS